MCVLSLLISESVRSGNPEDLSIDRQYKDFKVKHNYGTFNSFVALCYLELLTSTSGRKLIFKWEGELSHKPNSLSIHFSTHYNTYL